MPIGIKQKEQMRNKLITNLGVNNGFHAYKVCCDKFDSKNFPNNSQILSNEMNH